MEDKDWNYAIGGLTLKDPSVTKVGESVIIKFNKDSIDAEMRSNYGLKYIWDCIITLTKNGDQIDGELKCTNSEGKEGDAGTESKLSNLVDEFPKPADTNNFSQNILTALTPLQGKQ